MNKRRIQIILLTLVCILKTFSVFSEEITVSPLEAIPSIQPTVLEPHQIGELKVELSLPEGYRLYADSLKLKWLEPSGFQLAKHEVTPVVEFFDEVSKKIKKGVIGKAVLKASFESPEYIDSVPERLNLNLTYQACTAKFCLFPKTMTLTIPFQWKASRSVKETDTPLGQNEGDQKLSFWKLSFQDVFKKGLLLSFLFVFIAGVLTSFTPCIFPMIPITLAILGKNSHHRSRRKTLLLSHIYVFGIALTYALMGVLAATTGALFGSFMSHPIVLSLVCFIFLAMALSMLGLYDIQMPYFLRHKLTDDVQPKKGYFGVFLSGVISGVVASPCVGPVLVGILTYVAKTQDKWLGFWLLFVFALGMGQLLLLVGMFSSLTKWLPKSGAWMEGIKKFFGILLLAVFFYYFKLLVPFSVFRLVLGASLILLGFLLGPFHPLTGLPRWEQLRRVFSLILVGIGVLVLVFSLLRFHRSQETDRSTGFPHKTNEWSNYSDEIFQNAIQNGKPIVIDFYAEWCAACKQLDEITFTHQGLQLLATQFQLLRVDATEETPLLETLKNKYEIYGLPTVLFFDSQGRWMKELTLTEFEEPIPFIERMNKVLKSKAQ